MITVHAAFAILDAVPASRREELVPLGEALGRVAARDVVSDVAWPPFDTSAMDGYAVRAADAEALELDERPGLVAAGDRPPEALRANEAVRLMTGAPLPAGTDAVVPVEEAESVGSGRVRFGRAPKEGAHLRRRGESIAEAARLVQRGDRISPAGIALAALAGVDPIAVTSRAPVAIVPTGNELVAAGGARLREGQLRDSNGPMLQALFRARGWRATLEAPVADEPDAVDRLFRGERDGLLVTTGGVSAGDLDLLPPAAARAGWEILFHRVAVRPGKPIAFARRDDAFWFGLPGNPVSASAGFHLFVRRLIDRIEGAACAGPVVVTARLCGERLAGGPRETYRDAVLSERDGERVVEPLSSAGSHDVAAHGRANALVRIPAESPALEPGSLVSCVLLER